MTDREQIKTLLKASPNGTITTEQVTSAGLHRSILQELVDSGELYRFGRGLSVRTDAWEDDFYLLQLKYGRGIYSHDTALYLHGYSDRTPAPVSYTHLLCQAFQRRQCGGPLLLRLPDAREKG